MRVEKAIKKDLIQVHCEGVIWQMNRFEYSRYSLIEEIFVVEL